MLQVTIILSGSSFWGYEISSSCAPKTICDRVLLQLLKNAYIAHDCESKRHPVNNSSISLLYAKVLNYWLQGTITNSRLYARLNARAHPRHRRNFCQRYRDWLWRSKPQHLSWLNRCKEAGRPATIVTCPLGHYGDQTEFSGEDVNGYEQLSKSELPINQRF